MENANTHLEHEYAQMKLKQLTAILSAVAGGHGVEHMQMGEIQELLGACHGLAVEAMSLAN